jgi:hypothetical protein
MERATRIAAIGTRYRHHPGLRAFVCALLASFASAALAQGTLENPQPAGFESGIGLVSGWHCNAGQIQVQFDDRALVTAAYGTSRGDTAGACGDTNNGWGLLWNYNLLGPGAHTVRAFADGVQFASANFQVSTLGQEFVTGLSDMDTYVLSLGLGKQLALNWQQSKQGFVITEVENTGFFYSDFTAAYGGTWYGAWNSPSGGGAINLTLTKAANNRDLILTQVTMANTGCAVNSRPGDDALKINHPWLYMEMTDGSDLLLGFIVTQNDSMLGGTFYFDSGPCAGLEGIFHLSQH